MQRIVLRHISGSKANQVEEFPLNHVNELIFGRDPSATVKYDPDRDDLVGRQHAKLAPDASDPTQFVLTDLNSRNGTFLNRQRIVGSTKLAPGDRVQFGAGGPELEFDLEPRPQNSIRPTRAVALDSMAPTISGSSAIPQTRAINLEASAAPAAADSAAPRPTGTVGKATVERMISQNIAVTKRTERRKFALFGGGALVVVLLVFAAVAAYLFLRNRSAETQIAGITASRPLSPTEIAQKKGNAVVMLEVSWKLIAPDGGLVYHKGGPYGPSFVEVADGIYEPVLTDEEHKNGGQYIGGSFTASGFVVSSDGFI
ncbi:MAG: FHA domain-containing protein, partial [Acidobacteria bacterium]|nr:FHA domain-containing protein [Acidobacteriota bacterium]